MTAGGLAVKEKLAEITKRAVCRQCFKCWNKLESQKKQKQDWIPRQKTREKAAENLPKRRAPQKHH